MESTAQYWVPAWSVLEPFFELKLAQAWSNRAPRGKKTLAAQRIRIQNQVEALLEQGRIKLSSVISDLFGSSGRRILSALSQGKTDPEKLADLGNGRLKCGREVLKDAHAQGGKRAPEKTKAAVAPEGIDTSEQHCVRWRKRQCERRIVGYKKNSNGWFRGSAT